MEITERVEREQIQDIQDVMSSATSRRVLWRLISHCGVYQDINNDDPHFMSRKLGQRSVGLWLLQIIGDVSQEKLFIMMKEAEQRDKDLQKLAEFEDDLDEDMETPVSSSSQFI